jgi:enterochelin esterase-like enzyme
MISENTRQFTPTPTLGDNFTQVLPNGEVTFRLLAPQAQSVDLIIGFQCFPHEPQGGTTVPMTRNAQGLWSVSLGPLEANLYEYQFNLDGRKIPDPGNGLSKPQRQIETSLLLISGTTPSLLDSANSPHGTIHDETYHSVTLGKNRQVLVYTPPNYHTSDGSFPVLYLYHGAWDTRYSWVTEGRLAQMMDNLLAAGKVVPMVVVVPEAHALPPERIPVTDPDFDRTVLPYLIRNKKAIDRELFCDLIPFLEARYLVSQVPSERAIAGLSMGGLQAIDTGIAHDGYFGWIGAFSPATISGAFSEEYAKAMRNPKKVNENLLLFDIVTGDDDQMVGKHVFEFESQLRKAKVRHRFTVIAGGTHSMFVWRSALAAFLEQMFKGEVCH